MKSREVELGCQKSPGQMKSREVEQGSQKSPGQMKSREVEQGSHSRMLCLAAKLFLNSCFSGTVFVTLLRAAVQTAVSAVHKLLISHWRSVRS